MGMKRQSLFGGLITTFFVALGGYYIYWDTHKAPTSSDSAQTESSATANTEGLNIISQNTQTVDIQTPLLTESSGSGTAGVSAVPTIPVPSLERPIVFSVAFPDEAQKIMRDKIAQTSEALKVDKTYFNDWLNLGIYRKQIGDYEGARQAWDYASALQPNNNISFYNLGVLYHYYLKDFPKAESNFLTSIKKNPSYPQTYGELHDLYQFSYKQDTTAAIDILKQGLKAADHNINLLVKLAVYYRDVKKDSVNARLYFRQAKESATAAGDATRANALDAEIKALP